MKRFLAILLAALMMIPAFAMAEGVVKIGVFEPASGDSGAGGKQEMLGMQYANTVQPTVEIGGETYKVELVYADNGSSTDKAPSAAQQLVSEGVSVVLGSYGSGVSIAGCPVLRRRGHPRHRRDLHQPAGDRGQQPLLPHLLPGSLPGHGAGQLRLQRAGRDAPPTAWPSWATTTTWACATTSSRPLRRWAAR